MLALSVSTSSSRSPWATVCPGSTAISTTSTSSVFPGSSILISISSLIPRSSPPAQRPPRRRRPGTLASASGTGVGTLMNGEVTRTGAAFRSEKQDSTASAQISDANEYGEVASCATTSRPVRAIDPRIVSASSGCRLRGSTTSAEMPSDSSRSAASSARSTSRPIATIVTSVPVAAHVGDADRDRKSSSTVGVSRRTGEQPERLDEQHRVVVADRRLEQPLGVGGVGGHDDLQPGDARCTRPRSSASAGRRSGRRPPHIVRIVSGIDSPEK